VDELIAGYRRFRSERWPEERAHFQELAKGQKPHSLVIGCSDSRVDPATIFCARPGELFIVRNVAAIVPPYETGGGYHGTSAAIAFAILALEIKNILVLGHADCGGVAAALSLSERPAPLPFVSEWIGLLKPAMARCAHAPDPHIALEYETIRLSLERLRTFPFIAERLQAGTLQMKGARFGIASGRLEVLDSAGKNFEPAPLG
jgi:carbonic anhydrase